MVINLQLTVEQLNVITGGLRTAQAAMEDVLKVLQAQFAAQTDAPPLSVVPPAAPAGVP